MPQPQWTAPSLSTSFMVFPLLRPRQYTPAAEVLPMIPTYAFQKTIISQSPEALLCTRLTNFSPCMGILFVVSLWVTSFVWPSIFSFLKWRVVTWNPKWWCLSLTFNNSTTKILTGYTSKEKHLVPSFRYLGLDLGDILISMESHSTSLKNTSNMRLHPFSLITEMT